MTLSKKSPNREDNKTLQRYRGAGELKGQYQENSTEAPNHKRPNQGRFTKVVSALLCLDKGLEFVGTMKSNQRSDTQHKEKQAALYSKTLNRLNT